MAYNIGDRTGDYEIIDVLGAGGMGKVYKVRNVISDRVEAMKVLLPNLANDADLADRFMREIKVQASLQHPNIAALHTALRINNQLLMLIEFVEGSTIESVLRQGPIPVPKAIDYVKQVLLALSYAHSHGVIHRDIKPANMMLTPGGVVKLMDFGIAKLSADQRLTQTGRTVGSLYYMSPEQIQGAIDLDPRADLYSLGVSLYEMVTCTRPFRGDSDYSIMAAHLHSQPVPPIELDPALPPALSDIILMAIAKGTGHRFQTADAFRNALESLEGQSRSAGSITKVVNGPAPVAAAMAKPAPPSLPSMPAAPAGQSRRGLYMALGSLATVVVLALAAFQAPTWFGSEASTTTPAQEQQSSVAPLHGEPAQTPPVVAERAVTATQVTSPQPAPVTLPETPRRQTPTVASQKVAQNTPVPVQPEPVQQQTEPAPQPPVQQQPAPPPVDNAKVEALESAQEQLLTLGSRANAARAALSRMKEEQARQGLGMRGDILGAQERMEAFLDAAQAAIRAGDPDRAKKAFTSAEREIDRLDTFLGR